MGRGEGRGPSCWRLDGVRAILLFQAWETFKDVLVQAREDEVPDFLLYVHGFRSDATNSAIWQRRKLVALELESAPLSVL